MSKERARRRQALLEQRQHARIQRDRARQRRARWQRVLHNVAAPARSSGSLLRSVWRPLSGGQQGLLARRRRRRVVTLVVLATVLNIAVWTVTRDVNTAVTSLVVTLVASPVLGRLLFSRR